VADPNNAFPTADSLTFVAMCKPKLQARFSRATLTQGKDVVVELVKVCFLGCMQGWSRV
jgi:hypothetical protein